MAIESDGGEWEYLASEVGGRRCLTIVTALTAEAARAVTNAIDLNYGITGRDIIGCFIPRGHSPRMARTDPAEAHRKLPDGSATHTVINSMVDTWRREDGYTKAVWGLKYGYTDFDFINAGETPAGGDKYSKKHPPLHVATILEKLSWHALGRVWATGTRAEGEIGSEETIWWRLGHLRGDGPAVLLAGLDLILTGSPAVAEWYLSSPCLNWCRIHHHGLGDPLDTNPQPLPLDWPGMPRLAYLSATPRHQQQEKARR